MVRHDQRGFHHILVPIVVIILAVIGFTGWRVYEIQRAPQQDRKVTATTATGSSVTYDQTASRTLTGGNCSGAGAVSIGPPMPLAQTSFIMPYGEVIGGHVTPIDHQYYNGLNTQALRDTYDIIAPADGAIVGIEHRGNRVNTPLHTVDVPSSDEYRIVMAHTCSFLTYVDLVTSLDQNILKQLPKNWDPKQGFAGSIPIKKGEIIGHIGGQTLDFAVWDLSKPLSGFADFKDDYQNAEAWKLFTAPPTDYFDSSIKAKVIAKYIRTAKPIDGKIDYDQDGKLVGNWFLQSSGGYHDFSINKATNYWSGHLSIAPDFLDPTRYVASIGNYDSYLGPVNAMSYNGGAEQYVIQSASPKPTDVSQATGPVKYELAQKSYVLPNGQSWDARSFATGMKIQNGEPVGTILAQLTGARTLKFEAFPGKTAAQVSGFDHNAKIYTR